MRFSYKTNVAGDDLSTTPSSLSSIDEFLDYFEVAEDERAEEVFLERCEAKIEDIIDRFKDLKFGVNCDNKNEKYNFFDVDYEDEEEDELNILDYLQYVRLPRIRERSVIISRPIQLAARSSKFSTISQMLNHYSDISDRRRRESDEDMRRLSEENDMKLFKLQEEEMIKERIQAVEKTPEVQPARVTMAAFSSSLKENHLSSYSRNLFPHRRNGGGKKKTFKIPDAETIKSRRSERRKEKKMAKKSEETQRVIQFTAASNPSVLKEEITETYEEIAMTKDITPDTKTDFAVLSEKELDTMFFQSGKQVISCERDDEGEICDSVEDGESEDRKDIAWDEVMSDEDDVSAEVSDAEEKRRNMYQESFIEKKEIENILNTLGDKKKVQTLLSKTKFCRTVAGGKECPYGDTCTFAHSLEELKQGECIFGLRCKFISIVSGVVVNAFSTKKMCEMRHPSETKEECWTRLGLSNPHKAPVPAPAPAPEEVKKNTECIVLTVANDLATHAVNTALNSGHVDIKLKLIESQTCDFLSIKISKNIVHDALPSLLQTGKNIHLQLF